MRAAVRQLVSRLSGREVALYTFGERAFRVADFTRDTTKLEHKVDDVFALAEGESHVLDGIIEAAKDLARREAAVAMIVVVSAGSTIRAIARRGKCSSRSRQPIDRPCRRAAIDRRQRPAGERARPAELHVGPIRRGRARPPGSAAGPGHADARRLRPRLRRGAGSLARSIACSSASPRRWWSNTPQPEDRRPTCGSGPGWSAAWSGASVSTARHASRDGSAVAPARRPRPPPSSSPVLIAVWLASRHVSSPLVSGSCRGCNVLLITIDTLRPDRVGAFGGRAGLTPHLDRLAAEGRSRSRAHTRAAPLTLPSHASILTAVSPPVHGIRANGLFRLGPSLPTLATVLKAAGYRTGAFVGAFVLDARFGLDRGFDVYDDRYGEKRAGDPAEGAERRGGRRRQTRRRLDHGAVNPSPIQQISNPSPKLSPGSRGSTSTIPTSRTARRNLRVAARAVRRRSGVHRRDGRAAARRSSRVRSLDRTLVMVAADHGESLGEHGERSTASSSTTSPCGSRRSSRAQGSGSGVRVRRAGRGSSISRRRCSISLGVAAPPEFEGRSLVPAAVTRQRRRGARRRISRRWTRTSRATGRR